MTQLKLTKANLETESEPTESPKTRQELANVFNVTSQAIADWEKSGRLNNEGWELSGRKNKPLLYRRKTRSGTKISTGKFDSEIDDEAFGIYWKFATKRQNIFFNRLRDIAPLTDDPILQKYKFCNVYRASDRTSQFLIKEVIYSGNWSAKDTIFRILLFKTFNKIETWNYLQQKIGELSIASFHFDSFDKLLTDRKNSGSTIFNSAYINCATKAYGFDFTHQNFLGLLREITYKGGLDKIAGATSLRGIFDLLKKYPLVGNFLAYQWATDINYSPVIDFDENSFTCAGPGAKRGIDKCFINKGGASYEDIIFYMVENQHYWFDKLGLDFKTLWGRDLKAIDCQNLFCETDKYCRVALPKLESDRSQIKQKYTATPSNIEYFFPPKWELSLPS